MFTPRRRHLIPLILAALVGTVLVTTPAGETIAGFVDQEFANGTFSATKLNMEGSTDRSDSNTGTWADHFSDAATLTVTPLTVDPWTKAYAPFSLRLAQGSTSPASVKVGTGVATSDLSNAASKYRARMVLSPSGVCNASAFTGSATYLLGTSDAAGVPPLSTPSTTPFTLAAASESDPGAPRMACVEFGVPNDSSVNGTSITVQWTFNASST